MASLPVIKSLQAQDYPTQSSWISPLLYVLNLVVGSVYSALNNGLTLAQNSLAALSTLQISAASSTYYAAGPTTYATQSTSNVVAIPWSFKTRPVGCLPVNLIDTSSTPAPVLNAVSCDWSYIPGYILINAMSGLTAGKTYSCTFYVIGG